LRNGFVTLTLGFAFTSKPVSRTRHCIVDVGIVGGGYRRRLDTRTLGRGARNALSGRLDALDPAADPATEHSH
jgi:hypothetical protein